MIITLYSLLNVTTDAAPEVIEASYKALCKKLHPDNRETGDHERFTRIGEAYAILSDPKKRQEYDLLLKQKVSASVGLNDPLKGGRELQTVRRLNGTDTWCTIDEHIKRNGTELEATCLDRLILKNIKLQGANLSGCLMNHGVFENVKLLSVSMNGFVASNSTFSSVLFEDFVLDNATFSNCDFRGSIFKNVSLIKCTFTGCLFDGVTFAELATPFLGFGSGGVAASIQNCQFKSCSMSGTIFSSSRTAPDCISCVKVDFSGSNLSDASFSGSFLRECIFNQSVLVGTNFCNATLMGIDLCSCNLVNARFHDASLESVTFPPGYKPVSKVIATSRSQISRESIRLDLGKGVMMELIWCPPGRFIMGSPENEKGRQDDLAQRQVTISKGFWIGKTPVTQRQWETVMGFNVSNNKKDKFLGIFGGKTQPYNPVENVSYEYIQSFIQNLSQNKDVSYTLNLPTETQWEYACRAGTQTTYYFGNDESLLKNHAWFYANSGASTHPVGQKEPNPIGLYDLYGNVYEICMKEDVKHGFAACARGGCYHSDAVNCRSASRNTYFTIIQFGSENCGFRLAANPVE